MKSEKRIFYKKTDGSSASNRTPESHDCTGKCFGCFYAGLCQSDIIVGSFTGNADTVCT